MAEEGKGDGPPMVPHNTSDTPRKNKRRPVSSQAESDSWRDTYHPRNICSLEGPEHLIASQLPEGFPEDLAFRALAAYALLRTLSRELRLSPFTPNVFLRALNLPYPSRLLGLVHVALLRVLLPTIGYTYSPRGTVMAKKRKIDGLRWELRGGGNLTYLDLYTWPLFYDDYVHLTADILYEKINDATSYLDHKSRALQLGRGENSRTQVLQSDDDDNEYMEDEVLPPAQRGRGRGLPTLSGRKFVNTARGMEAAVSLGCKPPPFQPSSSKKRKFGVPGDSDSDEQFQTDDESDSDEDFEAPQSHRRKRTKTVATTATQQTATVAASRKMTVPFKPLFLPVVRSSVPGSGSSATPSLQHFTPIGQISMTPTAGVNAPPGGSPSLAMTCQTIRQNAAFQQMASYCLSPRSRWSSLPKQYFPMNPVRPFLPQPPSQTSATVTAVHRGTNPVIAGVPDASVPDSVKSTLRRVGMPTLARMPRPGVREVGMRRSHDGQVMTSIPCSAPAPPSVLQAPRPVVPVNPSMDLDRIMPPRAPKVQRAKANSKGIAVTDDIANSLENFLWGRRNSTKPVQINDPVPRASTGTVSVKPTLTSKMSRILDYRESLELQSRLHSEGNAGTQKSCDNTSWTSDKGGCGPVISAKAGEEKPSIDHGAPGSNGVEISISSDSMPENCGSLLPVKSLHVDAVMPQSRDIGCNDLEPVKPESTTPKAAQHPAHSCALKAVETVLPASSTLRSKRTQVPGVAANTSGVASNFTKVGTFAHIKHPDSLMKGSTPAHQDFSGGSFDAENHGCEELADNVGINQDTQEYQEEEVASNLPDEWPQLNSIKSLRRGIPYHRLTLQEKLEILEFLIDELLSVDYVAAEFTRRREVTMCKPNPFGVLATKEELEALENADECGVCGIEGDLICCDGCPSSYHKQCLGMDKRSTLPEGKWFCPECQIKDPAAFGSLRGDRKASVDWFTVRELRQVKGDNYGSLIGGLSQSSATSQSQISQDFPSVYTNLSSCGSSGVESYLSLLDTPLMVVHGFVFKKENASGERKLTIDSVEKFVELAAGSMSYVLTSGEDLYSFLQIVGPDLVSQWPLAQIPLKPLKVWGSPLAGFRDLLGTVFAASKSFDPSKYQSAYRLAPLPRALKASYSAKHHDLVMSDYEHDCHPADTKLLSCQMTADFLYDKSLSKALKLGTSLFSPYKMICGFLQHLELSLTRSGLMNEFWGFRSKALRLDTWTRNVQKCRSISRLSRLMVQLVDATHALAFHEEWFHSPFVRGSRKSSAEKEEDERLLYCSLPEDWDRESEKTKRNWEECTESNVLSLLSSSSNNLSEFMAGARLRDRLLGRKRKVVKVIPSKQYTPQDRVNASDLDKCLVVETIESTSVGTNIVVDATSKPVPLHVASPGLEQSLEQEQSNSNTRRLRRHHGEEHSGLANEGRSMLENVSRARKLKVKDFEGLLTIPTEKEIHWPVCGRYFFDPVGYLPPAEMKRLGRNAGTVVAPYLAYSNSYEVAQGAACHIWRKHCLGCDSFEHLLLQIRVLQSFLDQNILSTCESAVRRYEHNKSALQKCIVASQRSLANGELHYFVVQNNCGRWVSVHDVDPYLYVTERESRTEKIRVAWKQKKSLIETKRLEEEGSTRTKLQEIERKVEAVANVHSTISNDVRTMEAADDHQRQQQAAAQAQRHISSESMIHRQNAADYQRMVHEAQILQQQVAAIAQSRPGDGQFRLQQLAIASHNAQPIYQPQPISAHVALSSDSPPQQGYVPPVDIRKCQTDMNIVYHLHERETEAIYLRFMHGDNSIDPDKAMSELRERSFSQLRAVNKMIGFLGGPCTNEETLRILLKECEKRSFKKFEGEGDKQGRHTQAYGQHNFHGIANLGVIYGSSSYLGCPQRLITAAPTQQSIAPHDFQNPLDHMPLLMRSPNLRDNLTSFPMYNIAHPSNFQHQRGPIHPQGYSGSQPYYYPNPEIVNNSRTLPHASGLPQGLSRQQAPALGSVKTSLYQDRKKRCPEHIKTLVITSRKR